MDWSTSDTISAISAFAALGSAAFAYKTYLATVDLKKHDFALQLQTANATLRATVGGLPALLSQANRSRRALLAERGLLGGSVSNEWTKRVEAIQVEIDALTSRLPGEHVGMAPLGDLREQLAETHAFQVRASGVQVELLDALRADERENADLRQDRRAERAATRLPPPKL